MSFSFTEGPDYRFSTVSTNNLPAEFRLDIEDDDIALEFNDQLRLVYLPRPSNLIDRFERDGQFIRSSVSVFIEDNDSKACIYGLNNAFSIHITIQLSKKTLCVGILIHLIHTQPVLKMFPTIIHTQSTCM